MDPNLTHERVAVGCSEGFLGGSEHFEEFGGRTEYRKASQYDATRE